MQGQIKLVTPKDVIHLQQLSIESFSDTFRKDNDRAHLAEYLAKNYSDRQLTAEVANPDSEFYFNMVGEKYAGYIKLNVGQAQTEYRDADGMEIQRLYLKQRYKGQGLGRQLMEFAIKQAKKAGKKYLWLGVWEENESALSFYQKVGFIECGDHDFDFGGDHQRDILMKKEL
ncbi:GNAT family N-acetyltransferase [Eupransor demetentiae]|uniref:Ribosomal protein S18 acetylase RimI and related acetyltransferases (RimI) n=1 Tax=Eupransor demetentiae TaxID=3109584 RepID=A0ABP0EQ80_9LACO|nr:Ribosomal protein S18 acetylase RimI and related acetyltransferases (RimI) [Lactobacillaceae bacterium LMG 33000]